MVPSRDELRDIRPSIAMLGMQLNQKLFFLMGPFVALYASFEVVMIALSTLFSVSANNVVFGFHQSGDLAPFFDSIDLIEFLKDIVFLY